MSKFNLAVQLKQAIDTVVKFDTHPMQDAADENKINYLKALSLMIHADQTRHEGETAYLGAIYRTIRPAETTLDQLLAFAERPDFSDTQALITTLRETEAVGISFLMDLVMLAAADSALLAEEEKALIGAFRGFLGWDHTIYNRWITFCATIATGEGAPFELCLSSMPTKSTNHVLQHRGLKRTGVGASEDKWSKEKLRKKMPEIWEVPQLERLLVSAPVESMAAKVKTAFDAVAALGAHPLMEAGLEDKVNYLKALCLVMAADDRIAPDEQAYFGAVTRTLVNQDMMQGILEYAKNPDLSEVAAIVETLSKSENYKICLIGDALMLALSDGFYHQDEKDLVCQLRELIAFDKDLFSHNLNTAIAIAQEPEGFILNAIVSAFKNDYSKHILEYRGIAIDATFNLLAHLELNFEPIKYMSSGNIITGNLITKTPIKIRQFCDIINLSACHNDYTCESDILKLDGTGDIVALSCNGLSWKNGRLAYDLAKSLHPISGISPLAANIFCNYLTSYGKAVYEIPHVKGYSHQDVSKFSESNNCYVRHASRGFLIFKTEGSFARMSEQKPIDMSKISNGTELVIVVNHEKASSNEWAEGKFLFLLQNFQSTFRSQ